MINLRQFFRYPEGRATGIIFAMCGFIFGTWAALIPYVKQKFLLDEAQLGLLLLCMPAGTLLANPLSVFLISRFGAVRTAMVSIVLMSIAFAMPIIFPSVFLVALSLFFAGATFASTNIAMNTCASDLEATSKFNLMSTCHGMWSIGAMVGAMNSGFALMLFRKYCSHFIDEHMVLMALMILLVMWITWTLRKDLRMIHEVWKEKIRSPISGLMIFKPNKILWILISISLCTYLTEGTMADWSAVYLKEIVFVPETLAGWGFGVYAFFMALGRILGDELIVRYGNMAVLRTGGQLVLIGLVIVILSSNPWTAFPGFMLTGLGISIASPILYAAASRVPDMPPGAGLATLNTFGMLAFLGGPVMIGFVAKVFDLRVAFLLVAAAAVVWVVLTTVLTKRRKIY